MHSSMCFTYVQYTVLLNVFIYYLTKSDILRRILKTNQDLIQFYVFYFDVLKMISVGRNIWLKIS